MRTVAGALGGGTATVSGTTVAGSGPSGRRVVTEAMGLGKTPRKRIDRTVIIVPEKRAGTEKAGDQGCLATREHVRRLTEKLRLSRS